MVLSASFHDRRTTRQPTAPLHLSVRAYHQDLSLYLISLLRSTSSQSVYHVGQSSIFGPAPSVTSSRKRSSSSSSSTKLSSEEFRRTAVVSPVTTIAEEEELVSSSPHPLPADSTARPESTYVSREEEHRKAWEADGCKVWRAIPETFQLKLESDRSRQSSNRSGYCGPPGKVGLGIDMREGGPDANELAARMGLLLDTPPPEAENKGTTSRFDPAHPNGASLLISTSASVVVSPIMASCSSLASRGSAVPRNPTQPPNPKDLRDLSVRDDGDDYETKRQMRLRRKQAELRVKVEHWRESIYAEMGDLLVASDSFPNIPVLLQGTDTFRFSLPQHSASSVTLLPSSDFLLPFAPHSRKKTSVPKPRGDLAMLEALLGSPASRSISPAMRGKDGKPTLKLTSFDPRLMQYEWAATGPGGAGGVGGSTEALIDGQ